MGPGLGQLPDVPGVDGLVDYVIELRKFREDHKWVLITSPNQNGTGCWEASWAGTDGHDDGAPLHGLKHAHLWTLLGVLRKQFGEA